MALHPTVAGFLATLPHHEHGPVDPHALRVEEAGQVTPLEDRLPVHSVEDRDANGVPVRVITPAGADQVGIIVYFHGGAFLRGSLETHDHIARELANATGMRVVLVDYRLAPEHAFPAALDDCATVVRWAVSPEAGLAWDGTTLALAGDSSGGNFVAVTAADLLDAGFNQVTHQVLLYPSVDLDFDETRYASLRENAVGYGLETAGLKYHNAFYLDGGADPADPRVSPIKRDDLAGLPQALVVTAEYDPLRDEGEAYAERLRAAGVPAITRRWEGAQHGFVQFFGWVPEFHPVYDEVAQFLRGGK
ncbi:MAG: alpha/beta hydrolase [Microbacteriaceae bacterium]|nr:alpha/beta hydrolase [Microbacteriaceae bacterium]